MAIRWRHRVSTAVGGSAAALAGHLHYRLPAALSRLAINRLADLAWMLLGDRRSAVTGNVRRLAPGARPVDQRRLARATFRNFARCAADVLALPHAGRPRILDLVRITGLHHLDRAIEEGRGVIVVTPHLGNWELGGLALAALGYRAHALVESIDPDRDAILAAYRTLSGLQLIPSSAPPSRSLRILKGGGVLAVVADRSVGRASGQVAGFASGRRPVPRGPAWLALRSGAPVLPVRVVLTGRQTAPYDGHVDAPIPTDGLGPSPVTALTERIAAHLGQVAADYPDQWFVFDARWAEPPP